MSKAKTMGDLAYDGKPQPITDDYLRWATQNEPYPGIARVAAALLEARQALRELAALAWNPVGVVQSAEHFRKILRRVGYGPKE